MSVSLMGAVDMPRETARDINSPHKFFRAVCLRAADAKYII